MQLTESQQASVRQWASQGDGLSEIQTRLTEEFGLRLSYMEVRFLVLDLQIDIREKRAEAPKTPPAAGPSGLEDDSGDADTGLADETLEGGLHPEDGEFDPAGPSGNVRVEINRLAEPGLALNGEVTFSDGVQAHWGITSRGELSLAAPDPAYRPTNEDLQEFQVQLRQLISGGQGA